MKRAATYICLGIALVFALSACKQQDVNSSGLKIQKVILARKNNEGQTMPARRSIYIRGEKVYLIMANVGDFVKGADGLNWFDINMQLTDVDGDVVMHKEHMLGDKGHINLPDNRASYPYVMVHTHPSMSRGEYELQVTIYDEIGIGKATVTKIFTLE